MTEQIKGLLKELYPSSNPDIGVDFNKNGVIEEGEKVKDLDGNGTINDVDYGMLSFNNRNAFVYHNGMKRWGEVERYWEEAAQKSGPVTTKNEPTISANNNAGNEVLQERIINDKYAGEKNLKPPQAQDVVATQKEMKQLKDEYPSIDLEKVRPSETGEVLTAMKKVEDFNPNLAKNIKTISYNVDDCSEENPWVARLFCGGCAKDDNTVRINKWLTKPMLQEEEATIHEATHVYHQKIQKEEMEEMVRTQADFSYYAHNNYRLKDDDKKKFIIGGKPVTGGARDLAEGHLAKMASGKPCDKKVVELYETCKSAREESFDYKWNHVNQKYMPDSNYQDVETTGKNMEDAQGKFEALTVEAFGNDGKSPFWFDSFCGGGDRQQPVVKGQIEKMISNCKDETLKQKLVAAGKELDGTILKYKAAVDKRNLSKTFSIGVDGEDVGLVWKGVGPKEGLADPYGATNSEEAVATFVQYVYANGRLPYKFGDDRHNEMVKNYARLLRDYGFIRKDHPACKDL